MRTTILIEMTFFVLLVRAQTQRFFLFRFYCLRCLVRIDKNVDHQIRFQLLFALRSNDMQCIKRKNLHCKYCASKRKIVSYLYTLIFNLTRQCVLIAIQYIKRINILLEFSMRIFDKNDVKIN